MVKKEYLRAKLYTTAVERLLCKMREAGFTADCVAESTGFTAGEVLAMSEGVTVKGDAVQGDASNNKFLASAFANEWLNGFMAGAEDGVKQAGNILIQTSNERGCSRD